MSPVKHTLVAGGLVINTYSQPRKGVNVPVVVLFFLHGRLYSAADVEPHANRILDLIEEKRVNHVSKPAEDLLIVTFDQRNHGTRLLHQLGNYGWKEFTEFNNDRHAIDMYSMFTGTSRDVSFLIDFLPSYLYPSEERTISRWLVGGISLGGHATWFTLRNEPRVKIGIPIIGCPDYLALMSLRADKSAVPFAPPYIPKALVALIKRDDPASAPYTAADETNPFFGKKVLVLSGADDPIVPWTASEKFVERLNVGSGVKKVVVSPGVKHECTPAMIEDLVQFVWEEALATEL